MHITQINYHAKTVRKLRKRIFDLNYEINTVQSRDMREAEAVEAVKLLWKRKHFEERS